MAQQPQAAVSTLERAHRLHAAHHDAEAAAVLDDLLQRQPNDPGALTELATIRIAQADTGAAESLLTRALATTPAASRPNLLLGGLLLADHREPEAMDRFETVLAQQPRDTQARRGELDAVTALAVRTRGQGKPGLALKALQHARIALPDDPQLLLELGMQADELGMASDALEALTAARRLEPNRPEILYALARAQMDRQDMAAAESSFRAYLRLRPGDASGHFGLGRVLEVLQRSGEARAEFERSVALQPVQTESYYELGQMELDAGRLDQAEPLFEKTLARDPHHGGALTGMGILAFKRKEYARAEETLAQAETAAPQYGPAHYYRGLALARLGRRDESEAELNTAATLGREAHGLPVTAQP